MQYTQQHQEGSMTTRSQLMTLAAAAFLFAGCSDAQTEVFEPQFSKGGGGNAHFQVDGTDCTVSPAGVSCVFKIVGLGKNTSAIVSLGGNMTVSYNCTNNGGQSPAAWQGLQQQVSAGPLTYSSDKNGQISGSMSISAGAPPASELCPSHTWTVDVTQSQVNSWSLSAATKTGTIFYN
jgi:hypothetical protein